MSQRPGVFDKLMTSLQILSGLAEREYPSLLVHNCVSLTIGTNIERDHQDQPQDVFCSVYNTAKAIILGQRVPQCTFKSGYWNAGCKCV